MRIRRFAAIIMLAAALAFAACDDGPSNPERPWGFITLTGAAAATGSIDLAWTDPADIELDYVEVAWSLEGGPAGTREIDAGVASCSITGLASSTEYAVTLTAVNMAGKMSPVPSRFTIITAVSANLYYLFIYSVTDLNAVRGDAAGYGTWGPDCNYILMADLDLGVGPYNTGTGWAPIGLHAAPFTGIFNGNGHVIRNLFINDAATDYRGLFASISGASVYDLGLVSVNVTWREYTGALAGDSAGSTISGCHVAGSVCAADYALGGLVGYNQSSPMTDCYSAAAVTGQNYYWVGGLVGYNTGSALTGCHATGDVRGVNETGGLVGYNTNSPLTDCYSTGNVSGSGDATGGLAGYNAGSTVTGCHATGKVTGGGDNTGGLVGYGYNASILVNCRATGAVSGSGDNTGGLVGYNTNSPLTDCYSTGNVSGSGDATGGLAGYNAGSTVTGCHATGKVTGGGDNTGGLVGYNDVGELAKCYATGKVAGSASTEGGLVGGDMSACAYTSCFYDTDTTGMDGVTSGRNFGTAATTEQMKTQATFAGASPAWDFADVWAIDSAKKINNGYPYLIDNHL